MASKCAIHSCILGCVLAGTWAIIFYILSSRPCWRYIISMRQSMNPENLNSLRRIIQAGLFRKCFFYGVHEYPFIPLQISPTFQLHNRATLQSCWISDSRPQWLSKAISNRYAVHFFASRVPCHDGSIRDSCNFGSSWNCNITMHNEIVGFLAMFCQYTYNIRH